MLHPGLKIVKYKLPLVTRRPDIIRRVKRYLTVILSVASARIYDDILDKGITERGSLKLIKPWDKAADICQYFNCQKYGYITTRYTNKTRCTSYIKGYNIHEYKGLITKSLVKDILNYIAYG